MENVNYDKLINFWSLVTVAGLIISAIGVFYFRHYTSKKNEQSFLKASTERTKMKEGIDKEFESTITEIREHRDTLKLKMETEAEGIIEKIKTKSKEAANAIDKLRTESEEYTRQLNSEVNKLKYPIPEKLYMGLELNFKFSEDVDYSKLLNSYTNIPSSVIFEAGIPTSEFEEVYSIVSKRLGILQLLGSTRSSSELIFSLDSKNEMKYKIDRNTDNIVEFFIPKEDNATFGRLYYNIEDKDYNLTIYMFPFSFGRVPNVTSLLDLSELEIELSVNFISTNLSESRAIQLVDSKEQRLFLKTENTTFAEIVNIEILNNTQNNNRIKGKIEIREK